MINILNNLKFTFYIYSHPFDGFWVMKKEKTAKLQTGFVILLLLLVTTTLRILNSGFLFALGGVMNFSPWLLAVAVAVIVLLYCVANWALTTLADGMGTFSEIFLSVMYALTPLVIVNIPMTFLSQIFVQKEAAFYNFINAVVVLWILFLIFAGNLTIHEYSSFKTVVTAILSVAAMIAILILIFLVCNLTQQVWNWIATVGKEITFRLQ